MIDTSSVRFIDSRFPVRLQSIHIEISHSGLAEVSVHEPPAIMVQPDGSIWKWRTVGMNGEVLAEGVAFQQKEAIENAQQASERVLGARAAGAETTEPTERYTILP